MTLLDEPTGRWSLPGSGSETPRHAARPPSRARRRSRSRSTASRQRCPRARRSCARPPRPASTSPSSAPPTTSKRLVPAGSAWSRSKAAAARRRPAPRSCSDGMKVNTQHREGRASCVAARWSSTCPTTRSTAHLRRAGGCEMHDAGRQRSGCTASLRHQRREPPRRRQGHQQPLLRLRLQARASSARAACGPATRSRARWR